MPLKKDPDFDRKVNDIANIYLTAIERSEQGERTISTDEMTGIQALEGVQGASEQKTTLRL